MFQEGRGGGRGGKERQRGHSPPRRGTGRTELVGKRGRRARSERSGPWRSCRHCSVWAEPEGGGEGRARAAATAAGPLGRDAAAAGASLTFRAEEEEEEEEVALREFGVGGMPR